MRQGVGEDSGVARDGRIRRELEQDDERPVMADRIVLRAHRLVDAGGFVGQALQGGGGSVGAAQPRGLGEDGGYGAGVRRQAENHPRPDDAPA